MAIILLAVAIGGGIGAIFRYLLSKLIQERTGIEFPVGTLFVNLIASFLIGFFFSYLVEKLSISPTLRAFLITGILGGFSTFSTFTYESYYLMLNGEFIKLVLYIFSSVGLGIVMTLLGYNLGRVL